MRLQNLYSPTLDINTTHPTYLDCMLMIYVEMLVQANIFRVFGGFQCLVVQDNPDHVEVNKHTASPEDYFSTDSFRLTRDTHVFFIPCLFSEFSPPKP